MNAGTSFAADAAIYDRSRRQLVPCFDDFYGTAVALSPFERDAAIHILDLGAGTGLMSAFFADAHPHARFTLVDVAAEMLDRARARFASDAGRFACVTLDYAVELPPGTFDLVVSGLSIHHLSDARQGRSVRPHLRGARGRTAPSSTPTRCWAERRPSKRATTRHGSRARAGSASRRQISTPQIERMKHDRTATLADQLRWLDEAGFRDVDCAYKHYRFAVYSGRK